MCSWIHKNLSATDQSDTLMKCDVPSIRDIQQTLVNIQDKPPEFLDSKEWVGALEVSVFISLQEFHYSNSLYQAQLNNPF